MEEALPETGPGAVIATDAEADMLASAALVAVTVKFPALFPATNKPVAEIVPPVAVQFTAVFDVPVTVAENCWDAPSSRGADVGEMATLTEGGGGFFCGVPPELVAPVHPDRTENDNNKMLNPARWMEKFRAAASERFPSQVEMAIFGRGMTYNPTYMLPGGSANPNWPLVQIWASVDQTMNLREDFRRCWIVAGIIVKECAAS